MLSLKGFLESSQTRRGHLGGFGEGVRTSRYQAQKQCVRETAGSDREPCLARSGE